MNLVLRPKFQWMQDMSVNKINLKDKLSKFSEHWSPRIIAEMNDYQFKLAKIKGEFVWHDHKDTDEVFIVIEGTMSIEFRDGTVVKPHLTPPPAVTGIAEGNIIEIISGPFKGEKASVQRIDEPKEEVTVELIEAMVPIPITVRGDHQLPSFSTYGYSQPPVGHGIAILDAAR